MCLSQHGCYVSLLSFLFSVSEFVIPSLGFDNHNLVVDLVKYDIFPSL